MEEKTIFININQRQQVFDRLKKLRADDKPGFGLMGPQHMVEHLGLVLRFCNGKAPQQLHFPKEKADMVKSVLIYTDKEISAGFKTPILPKDGLLPLEFPSLDTAIAALSHELDAFDQYFKQFPQAKPMNPIMGELDHREWTIFQNKHFTHHYKQFGLL